MTPAGTGRSPTPRQAFLPPDVLEVPTGRHDGRHRTVRRTWPTDPVTAYRLLSDVVATAKHSPEVERVAWDRRARAQAPSVGDRFCARNRNGRMRWTSTSTVVAAEPGRRFAFVVGQAHRPTAIWSFDLEAIAGGTRTTVAYTVALGDGPSMFDTMRHLADEQYGAAVDERLDNLAASMTAMLDALAPAVPA